MLVEQRYLDRRRYFRPFCYLFLCFTTNLFKFRRFTSSLLLYYTSCVLRVDVCPRKWICGLRVIGLTIEAISGLRLP
ncbi:hypothetical protein Csa_007647 [Cucumis sativus]|uniref:Uncharacterized protein n=1 Tax=Cucumis sativus TaxID=3659 RepID=A0A0A0M3D1_CUCSA|nr:hypothetical protein Csa_007647 [Cucumis sativus]